MLSNEYVGQMTAKYGILRVWKDNVVQGVGINQRSRVTRVNLMVMKGWVVFFIGLVMVNGSEFPERECCDPIYPPNTATTAAAPVTHPVSRVSGQWNY